jgi:hypothetical protein
MAKRGVRGANVVAVTPAGAERLSRAGGYRRGGARRNAERRRFRAADRRLAERGRRHAGRSERDVTSASHARAADPSSGGMMGRVVADAGRMGSALP